MDDLIAWANDPALLASLVLAAAVFATVVTLAAPMFKSDRLASRMRDVADQRERLRRRDRERGARNRGLRLNERNKFQTLTERLNLEKLIADDTLAAKLAQAGLRGTKPVSIYYVARFSLPFVFAALAFIALGVAPQAKDMAMMTKLSVVCGALGFGFYAPTLYLNNMIQKRKQSIMKAFPDSLDMLLICIESGMSIEMAMHRVSQEIGTASIELAEELALCTAELSYLPDRRSAYENLGIRTNHPGVKSVAMALVQAERYGTPLGQALRVMAKENRELRMTEAEKKAAALPAQLTVPMITFFLPVLCIILVAPAGIQISAMMAK